MEVDGEEALEEHDQPSWCRGGWRDSEQCMAGGSWLKGPWVQKASGGSMPRGRVCARRWGIQLRGWSRPHGEGVAKAWPGSHTRESQEMCR